MALECLDTVHLTKRWVADSKLADQQRRKLWNRPTVTSVVHRAVHCPQMRSSCPDSVESGTQHL